MRSPFFVLEGISYAGKSTAARLILPRLSAVLAPRVASGFEAREASIHDNPDHGARLTFFLEEIDARSEEISQLTHQALVISDRYYQSVLAYHSILLGTTLRVEFGRFFEPNLTILLTVNEQAIIDRMNRRPPRHRYEADIEFLMSVQNEFFTRSSSTTVQIDTSKLSIRDVYSRILSIIVDHERRSKAHL